MGRGCRSGYKMTHSVSTHSFTLTCVRNELILYLLKRPDSFFSHLRQSLLEQRTSFAHSSHTPMMQTFSFHTWQEIKSPNYSFLVLVHSSFISHQLQIGLQGKIQISNCAISRLESGRTRLSYIRMRNIKTQIKTRTLLVHKYRLVFSPASIARDLSFMLKIGYLGAGALSNLFIISDFFESIVCIRSFPRSQVRILREGGRGSKKDRWRLRASISTFRSGISVLFTKLPSVPSVSSGMVE